MIGIYCYRNMINGQYYVGQSVDLVRRKKDHKARAFNNPDNPEYNSVLHQAFRKYGYEAFEYTVLEECRVDELNDREIYWIKKLDSYNNGYNCTLGGSTSHFFKFNEQILNDVYNALVNSTLTFQEIHEKYNVSIGFVCDFNSGKVWHNDDMTYPLRNTELLHTKTKHYCRICNKQLYSITKTGLCAVCAAASRRKVERPSREELKKLIRSVPFTTIGKQYDVNDNTVRKWCDSYHLPRKKSDIKQYSDEEWLLI